MNAPAAPYLPKAATLEQAQAWLEHETGQQWPLARLLEETGIMPRVWLDYSRDAPPEVFAGRLEGYLAPLMFAGDTQRLAAGADEIVITMTESADGQLIQLEGMRCPLSELRFMADDLRENARAYKDAAPSGAPEKAAPPMPRVAPDAVTITLNKLRTNSLDAPIRAAIKKAGSIKTAAVFTCLKELALNGDAPPFTGAFEGAALCYTDDNDAPARLTKNALDKRLAKYRNESA